VLDLLLDRFKGNLRIVKDGQDLGLLYENDSNLKSDVALYLTVIIGNNVCQFRVVQPDVIQAVEQEQPQAEEAKIEEPQVDEAIVDQETSKFDKIIQMYDLQQDETFKEVLHKIDALDCTDVQKLILDFAIKDKKSVRMLDSKIQSSYENYDQSSTLQK
jgi:hypothetical protein